MNRTIGIRREDKNIWERRVPLIPEHVAELYEKFGIKTILENFERRAFTEQEFSSAGTEYRDDLKDCSIILGVKEVPIKLLMPEKTYLFFSHTIKGQVYNMPLLQKMMDLKCTLIDYECIKNSSGKRLVFFGHYAGVAGMIDTLHGYGKRLRHLGYSNPLENIKSAYEYKDVNEAKEQIKKVADEIIQFGMPAVKAPYVFGFAGYGNVSRGAQEIFDLLPFKEITVNELHDLATNENKLFYKVVFKEEDLVRTKFENDRFELHDYFENPQKYESKFYEHIPFLSVIINCIFWNQKYPRFVTKEFLKSHKNGKLDLICDITCDINGAIEITHKSTVSDNPAYVYNPESDTSQDGYEGEGIVNIAVDNLPTELPRDASIEFSNSLFQFIPGLVNADINLPFNEVDYPDEIKRAVILYKGELTPDFKYLEKYLSGK